MHTPYTFAWPTQSSPRYLKPGNYQMSIVSIKPVKIVFIATGTYNQQYLRPYEANPTMEAVTALREQTKDGTNLSVNTVAGVASSIVRPNAAPSKTANIISGWNHDRYRFMFMFDVNYADGSHVRQVLAGYTNYTGISGTGNIDPKMQLHLNSSYILRPYTMNTDRGTIVRYNQVSNASIITNPNLYATVDGTMDDQVMQRPQDLFDNLSASADAASDGAMALIDYRTQVSTNAAKSNRSNGSISNYLARSLNAHRSAIIDACESNKPVDVRSEASGYAADAEMTIDPILSALACNANTDYINSGIMSFNDLTILIPGIDQVAHVFNKATAHKVGGSDNRQPHVAGQTESLHTPTHESVAVTILGNAISSNMADTLLTGAKFVATNQTVDGSIAINMDEVYSFMDGVDTTSQGQYFMNCLRSTLMDISFGNTRTFMISVQADIYGETYINLSMDGKPSVPYCVPSFADSMISPVLCNGAIMLNNMATDLENVSTNIQTRLMNQTYNPYSTNY